MLALLTRRLLPALILPAISLSPASSALGAPHSRSERSHAVHSKHTRGKHHKAYRKSGKKAYRQYGRKADRISVGGKQGGTFDLTLTPILLGENVVLSQQDYLRSGQAEAFSLYATASGVAGAIHLYIDSHNRARTVVVGLYSNTGNRPGSLLSGGHLDHRADCTQPTYLRRHLLAGHPRRGRDPALPRSWPRSVSQPDQRSDQPRWTAVLMEHRQRLRRLPGLRLRDPSHYCGTAAH